VFKITAVIDFLLQNRDYVKEEGPMVHISEIEAQVSQLGVRLSRWFRAELRELQHILMDHEKIIAVVPGRYFGGFALLVATDQRLLLIDKRTFFMNFEDIRYDMISETDYNSRFFDCTLQIFTLNKQHRFTSVKNKDHLRKLTRYIQQRIMEVRHYQNSNSPQMSLINTHPAERFPSEPVQQQHQPAPPTRYAMPSTAQTKVVGAAAIVGSSRLRPFTNMPLSTRSTAVLSSNVPR